MTRNVRADDFFRSAIDCLKRAQKIESAAARFRLLKLAAEKYEKYKELINGQQGHKSAALQKR